VPPTRRRQPSPVRRPPTGRRPRPRPPVRLSTRIAGGVALLVITASGVGHAVVTGLNGAINRVDAFGGMQNRPGDSKGTNFLLVGTDGRGGLNPTEKKAYHLGGAPCHCTDTIMLVHLSQDRQRASVVSIPRDTYVQLPGVGSPAAKGDDRSASGRTVPATHPAKINAAYAVGGPKLTVSTVERLTGVHIDHYLEVDFVSFMKTVDVLGGVPVCTTRPLKDSYTGLDLPVGTTTLNGGEALQYVRSRHIDADSDLGRMRRQQRFVAQVIHKVTSGGTLTNPMKLEKVASTVLGSVRADEGLQPTDLIALARSMKGFTSDSSEFTSVPLSNLNYSVPGVGSTVKWDADKAGRLWAAIRADQPIAAPGPEATRGTDAKAAKAVRVDVAPSRISVRVENAAGVNGLGAAAQNALHATGFVDAGLPTTADRHSKQTVVRYDPRWDRSAKSLAAALPGARLVKVTGQGPVMQVTVGMDYKKVQPVTADAPEASDTARTGDQVTC
jgi:LCP family protein required for cell wall assembly